MKVNYGEKPSLFSLDKLPSGKILVSLRENIASDIIDGEDGLMTVWTADEYTTIVFPRAGLEADIENRYADYLARAKAAESAQAAAKEKEKLEAEMQNNLAETLLEMDYEIMIMKEFGGAL